MTMLKRLMPATLAVALPVLLLFVAAASAQEDEPGSVELTVSESDEFGEHLATGEDFALYLYTEDEEGASSCEDACARNWPPLLVSDGESVSAGDGVDEDMIGTTERSDGTLQVTYGGQPLYMSRHDTEGTTRGQKTGRGVFTLVSPEGTGITEAVAKEEAEVDEETFGTLMATGESVYASQCAVCHGPEGRGGVGPRLAGNSIVGNTDFLVERVLNGFPEHGMPPFRDVLDDQQIAAVSTFVRNSFGNDFSAVTEDEVGERR